MRRGASKPVVSLEQQFDVLDVRRDLVGGKRRLRVDLGEAVEAEHLRIRLAPEIGVVTFPKAASPAGGGTNQHLDSPAGFPHPATAWPRWRTAPVPARRISDAKSLARVRQRIKLDQTLPI